MFNMFAYPLIYSLTTGFSIPVILLWPNFMFLYAIDRELFVDWDATAHVSDLYMVPRKGLPTALAQMYNIEALLWGDYTFLVDETQLRISITMLAQMYGLAWFQLIFAAVVETFMVLWGAMSLVAIGTIGFYEFVVLDISFI